MIQILRTSTIPPRYQQDLFTQHITDAEQCSYQELRERLFSWFINEFDQYSYYTGLSEHYRMEDIIVNVPLLQKKWALEHGADPEAGADGILKAQIAYYRPAIFCDNSYFFMRHDAEEIKSKFGVQRIIAWDGYTGSDFKKQSKGVDLVMTCVEYIRRIYTELGFESKLLPFGFDQRIFERVGSGLEVVDRLCFTGSISDHVHKERKELILAAIRSEIPFDLHIGNLGGKSSLLSRAQIRALKDLRLADFRDYYTIQRHNRGAVYGLEMYKTIGQSRVHLNNHGDGSKQAGNMRLYEATGMGTLLLSDWKSNLSDIFEPDKEIVTYRTVPEAIEKAKYYISHPEEAAAIAANGQKRTFEQYSTRNRINLFIQYCDELMA